MRNDSHLDQKLVNSRPTVDRDVDPVLSVNGDVDGVSREYRSRVLIKGIV